MSMDPSVKKWLLGKAKEELKDARTELDDARAMVKEYEKRVVDPEWNLGSTTSGKETWGGEVKEWKKERAQAAKKVELLEKVVEGLS